MGLLVQSGRFQEVFCNRLPVGHTHIDVDGRNAIYSKHFFGQGAKGTARVESVNTLSQFDAEVKRAFKETFYLKRLEGLLAVGELWNGWLHYKRFGPPRKQSAQALAQGGRLQEPMSMRFFMASTGEYSGRVLMQYRDHEDTNAWKPYHDDGAPVFSTRAGGSAGGSASECTQNPRAVCVEESRGGGAPPDHVREADGG
jgi:hypothetical protein